MKFVSNLLKPTILHTCCLSATWLPGAQLSMRDLSIMSITTFCYLNFDLRVTWSIIGRLDP